MVPGDPFFTDPDRVREYSRLMNEEVGIVRRGGKPQTAKLRAWIREADRTIRANNEVYGIAADAEEDLPWIARAWRSFLRIFTAK